MSRRRVLAGIIATTLLAAATATGTGAQASAPLEFRRATALPGFVRTDLKAHAIDVSPDGGVLYAAADIAASTSLFAIDLDDLSTIADVSVVGGTREVLEVDVSPDGADVYVLTTTQLRRYDAGTLGLEDTQDLAAEDDTWRIAIAPGPTRRYVTYSWNRHGTLYRDGSSPVDLTSTGSTAHSRYVFGDDGSLYRNLGNRIQRVDPDTGAVLQSRQSNVGAMKSMAFGGGSIWLNERRIDPATLDDVGELDSGGVGFPQTHARTDAGGVIVEAGSWDWRLHDFDAPDEPAVRFAPPGHGTSEVFAAVPVPNRDMIAILEGTFATNETYLAVFEPGVLASGYGHLTPVDPTRVLDTRERLGAGGPLSADETIDVQITGVSGLPETGVLAVVMNIAATGATAQSHFRIWPADSDRPLVSNLNFPPGRALANMVTVPVSESGAVSLYNRAGSVDAIFDVIGYYTDETQPPGSRYQEALLPERLVDTRIGLGANTIGPGREVVIDTTSLVGVPPGTVALAVNVTAVTPSQNGFLTLWANGVDRPIASNLNYVRGEIRPNMALVRVDADGRFRIFNRSGFTDVVVDVFGYYTETTSSYDGSTQAGRLLPVEPFRRFDSREDSPFPDGGAIWPENGVILSLEFSWTAIMNIAAVNPTERGYLSVIPFSEGQQYDRPSTANVNFTPGSVVANMAYATGSPDFVIVNPFGFTHVVVDTFAYLTSGYVRHPEEFWQ